jgi:ribosomal protein RSM22 (predicted rRNA methylase)
MMLPTELQRALEREFENVPLRQVASKAVELRKRYRDGPASVQGSFVQSEQDVLAYAAYRFAATFAAVRSALLEVKERLPQWSPLSLLDVGAGPGTAAWAALSVWPEIRHVTLVEKDARMIRLCRRLAKESSVRAIEDAQVEQVDILDEWQLKPHCLVVAAYVLAELPESKHQGLVNRLWRSTHHTLCLIEPAKSPRGFNVIIRAREQLMNNHAFIVAPCPHQARCPMAGSKRWCHFGQRIERTRIHRVVKGGFRPYEDEKFSYVAASHTKGTPIAGRVTLPSRIHSGFIEIELCRPDGLVRVVVTKRDKEAFRQSRKLHWGQGIADDSPEPLAKSGHAEP